MRRQTNRVTGTVMDEWYGALAALRGSDTDDGFDEARRKLDGGRLKVHKYFKGLTQQRRDKILATWPSVLNKKIVLTEQDIHFIEKPDWLTLFRGAEAA